MDKLTIDFLSFIIPYATIVVGISLILALIIAKDGIVKIRDYYKKREDKLMKELEKEISARVDAERKLADIRANQLK